MNTEIKIIDTPNGRLVKAFNPKLKREGYYLPAGGFSASLEVATELLGKDVDNIGSTRLFAPSGERVSVPWWPARVYD